MRLFPTLDPDAAPTVTRDALAGLDRLLGAMPANDNVPAREMSALVRLLAGAAAIASPPPQPID